MTPPGVEMTFRVPHDEASSPHVVKILSTDVTVHEDTDTNGAWKDRGNHEEPPKVCTIYYVFSCSY